MGIMTKQFILILFLFFSWLAFSQEKPTIEKIDGKEYVIIVIQEGQTLYSIHQELETEIKIIKKHNKNVSDGLQIGQKIKVPLSKTKYKNVLKENIHIVEPRETVFAISRKYNCSAQKIIDANPAAENGIQVGQELIIPCKGSTIDTESEVSFEETEQTEVEDTSKVDGKHQDDKVFEVNYEDSIVIYTVQPKETLYSISKRFMVSIDKLVELNNIKDNNIQPGQKLTIPLKKEFADKYDVKGLDTTSFEVGDTLAPQIDKDKDIYDVAILLPLKIDLNAAVFTGLYDEKTRLNDVTKIALDFYIGAIDALDSLEKIGLRANVKIIDTEGSKTKVESVIENGELDDFDLIFGPFYPVNIEVIADFCNVNRIPLFIPVAASTELAKNNPFVNLLVPSELTQIGAMAEYIAKHHGNHSINILKGSNDKENGYIDYFLKVYNDVAESGSSSINEITLGSSSGRNLAQTIELDTQNVYICLSEDYQQVMKFINTLNAAKNYSNRYNKADIIAFGTREWHNIKSLNSYYKNRFTLHTPLPLFVDYEDELVKRYVKQLHEDKKIDPTRFYFQGYDVLMQTCSALLLDIITDGVVNKFNLQSLGQGYGSENGNVFIVKQDDFSLKSQEITTHSPFPNVQKSEVEDEE